MAEEQIYFYASYINKYCKWKFHYGRMVTVARMKKLELPNIQFENR